MRQFGPKKSLNKYQQYSQQFWTIPSLSTYLSMSKCLNILILYILITRRMDTLWSEAVETFWFEVFDTFWHKKLQIQNIQLLTTWITQFCVITYPNSFIFDLGYTIHPNPILWMNLKLKKLPIFYARIYTIKKLNV